jgi:hypothetical protein
MGMLKAATYSAKPGVLITVTTNSTMKNEAHSSETSVSQTA